MVKYYRSTSIDKAFIVFFGKVFDLKDIIKEEQDIHNIHLIIYRSDKATPLFDLGNESDREDYEMITDGDWEEIHYTETLKYMN